jgi:hypothetical protein
LLKEFHAQNICRTLRRMVNKKVIQLTLLRARDKLAMSGMLCGVAGQYKH